MRDICAVVLAAGKGIRMGGDIPKVLCPLLGKPLIYWALDLLTKVGVRNVFVVTGYKARLVEEEIGKQGFKPRFIRQVRQLGTAHSLKKALEKISSKFKTILVVFGDDSSLYTQGTFLSFVKIHLSAKNNATVMVVNSHRALSIGGVQKNQNGDLTRIVTRSEIEVGKLKNIVLLCGAFCFTRAWVEKILLRIEKNPTSGEYPLPKFIEIAAQSGEYVKAFELTSKDEWNSINTPEELRIAESKKRRMLNV